MRRSVANVDRLLTAAVPPPAYHHQPHHAADAPPPPYLRGPLARLFALKQALVGDVHRTVAGLQAQYGFQGGDTGSAVCAADHLVADLTGGPGAVWLGGVGEAVAELHERAFENFNRWAHMVRGWWVWGRGAGGGGGREGRTPHEACRGAMVGEHL